MMSEQLSINEANSVFEQPWWLDIVAAGSWQEISVKDKNGRVIGRLPYTNQSVFGLKVCGVPALTQQMGPWFHYDNNMKPVARLKRIKQVSEELIKQLSDKSNIDLYFHSSYQYVLPFIWAGYNVEPKFSYVIDDLSDLNTVFGAMDAKVRNLIKNAEKQFSVTEDVDVEILLQLLCSTFAKQNRSLPMDEIMLRKIIEYTSENGGGMLFGARNNASGEIVAVAFFLYDKNTCYYLLGGKDYRLSTQGVQEFLLWEGIKFASAVSKEFDFEGSMIPGIESFFRGFGGTPRTYYRVWRGSGLFCLMQRLKPAIKRLLHYK